MQTGLRVLAADDVARYMAAGADGVLTKPVQVPALFAVLAGRGLPATVAAQDAA